MIPRRKYSSSVNHNYSVGSKFTLLGQLDDVG
ncbi:MAG: hypothetical protein DRJ26_00635 [Candidatus Methanomethylicota archaeon]|uniref:Uncharacterized protein n=1 Tax=Thermoproteota archaeon TaxID=2056631 RepID=A0A497F941_9CREN|nr:MAG: hypothetical protein DRJ26_00635 [Candidatus Verstraetearchaeota archaeon]